MQKMILLPHRTCLEISGPDRFDFLQGLITNDINLLSAQMAIYTLMLNPQGRFFCDLFIYNWKDKFLVDCEREQATELLKKLSMYKLRSNIAIKPIDFISVYSILPNHDHDLNKNKNVSFEDVFSVADPRTDFLGTRLYCFDEQCVNELSSRFSIDHHLDNYDNVRILLNIPDGTRDMIVGRSTALECGMDILNAISWTKGCYMGQELTARSKYTGIVRKGFLPFILPDDLSTSPDNNAIFFNGQEAGEMRSYTSQYGLGFIRLEYIDLYKEQINKKDNSGSFFWRDFKISPVFSS